MTIRSKLLLERSLVVGSNIPQNRGPVPKRLERFRIRSTLGVDGERVALEIHPMAARTFLHDMMRDQFRLTLERRTASRDIGPESSQYLRLV